MDHEFHVWYTGESGVLVCDCGVLADIQDSAERRAIRQAAYLLHDQRSRITSADAWTALFNAENYLWRLLQE